MMMRVLRCLAAMTLIAMTLGRPVLGSGLKTATVRVGSSVQANCTIANATLSFLNYDPDVNNRTAPLDVQGTIQYDCTKGVAPRIGLSTGLNAPHAAGTTRAMSTGGAAPAYLSYEIYQNSGRTVLWSDANPDVPGPVPTARTQSTVTMFGRVPAGQKVPVSDAYSDALTATINF